jgi:vancomycin resistance protein VanW
MKPLSLYHPALYWLRVWQKRLFRQIAWHCSSKRYARLVAGADRLPFRYLKHTSKLIRKLGDSDLALQHNKVINLKLAVAAIDGLIIAPGEYFSFCRLVGRPTANAATSKAWNCPSAKHDAVSAAESAN